jgi:hypothetical protein
MRKLISGFLMVVSFFVLAVVASGDTKQKPVHSKTAHALEATVSEAVFNQVPAIIGSEENKYEKQYDWTNKK